MSTKNASSMLLEGMSQLATQLLLDSLKSSTTLLEKAASLLSAAPQSGHHPGHHDASPCGCGKPGCCGGDACPCCGIPETCCPPRCVCFMTLAAMTGQAVSAGLRVVNESDETRHFVFAATPFLSGSTAASFTVHPGGLTLGPRQSGYAVASLTIPASFHTGRYEAEITVTGAYEQCVKVTLEVGCAEHRSGTCEIVEQHERFRIRAHHWYDHFQCVEPCGPVHPRGDRDRADHLHDHAPGLAVAP